MTLPQQILEMDKAWRREVAERDARIAELERQRKNDIDLLLECKRRIYAPWLIDRIDRALEGK
jgi:hypothetical protein